jgi:hypothetical protein
MDLGCSVDPDQIANQIADQMNLAPGPVAETAHLLRIS